MPSALHVFPTLWQKIFLNWTELKLFQVINQLLCMHGFTGVRTSACHYPKSFSSFMLELGPLNVHLIPI